MTSVPTARTWATSDALSATNLNGYISDPITFLLNRPAAQVRQTSAQTIATSTATSLLFNVEDLDDDPAGTSGHSTSSNTSRYTAVYAGWYRCTGASSWASNATGRRGCRWAVNGSSLASGDLLLPTYSGQPVNAAARDMLVYLTVGDYVELQGYQESGGNLATSVLTTLEPHMTVVWERLAA